MQSNNSETCIRSLCTTKKQTQNHHLCASACLPACLRTLYTPQPYSQKGTDQMGNQIRHSSPGCGGITQVNGYKSHGQGSYQRRDFACQFVIVPSLILVTDLIRDRNDAESLEVFVGF
mmetsp:Transcript_24980/g.44263  ORF Transcript_24980/g.44263 Transcript_24980/m.44263 type:complete len:118 (-) Transcript_24980:208-561(-)